MTFGLGVLNSLISVPAQTTLQDHSSDDIRARVFGAFYTIQNIIILVPLVLVGALADALGVVTTISVMALAVIAVSLWGLRHILEPAGEQQPVRE